MFPLDVTPWACKQEPHTTDNTNEDEHVDVTTSWTVDGLTHDVRMMAGDSPLSAAINKSGQGAMENHEKDSHDFPTEPHNYEGRLQVFNFAFGIHIYLFGENLYEEGSCFCTPTM